MKRAIFPNCLVVALVLLFAGAFFTGCRPARTVGSQNEMAGELVEALDVETAYLKELIQILTGMLDVSPELSLSVDIIADYMEERVGWEMMHAVFIERYASEFTAREMQEIIAFYRTPAGRKLLEASPRIGESIRQEVEKRVHADMDYLQLAIKERELEAMLQRLDQVKPLERPPMP